MRVTNKQFIHGLNMMMHSVATGIKNRAIVPSLFKVTRHIVQHSVNRLDHRHHQYRDRDLNLANHLATLVERIDGSTPDRLPVLWNAIRSVPALSVNSVAGTISHGHRKGHIPINLERLVGAIGATDSHDIAREFIKDYRDFEQGVVNSIKTHATGFIAPKVEHYQIDNGHQALNAYNPNVSASWEHDLANEPEIGGGSLDTGERGISKLLDKHRGWKVVGVKAGRKPLALQGFLHFIAGDYKKPQHDKYFHMYNKLKLMNPATGEIKNVLHEKNENTQIVYLNNDWEKPLSRASEEREIAGVSDSNPIDIEDWVNRGRDQQESNGRDYNGYSIATNNCQDYARDHLIANGLHTPELDGFIHQGADKMGLTWQDKVVGKLTGLKRHINKAHDLFNDGKEFVKNKLDSVKGFFSGLLGKKKTPSTIDSELNISGFMLPSGAAADQPKLVQDKMDRTKAWLADQSEQMMPWAVGTAGLQTEPNIDPSDQAQYEQALSTSHLVDHGYAKPAPITDTSSLVSAMAVPHGTNTEQQGAMVEAMD